MKTAAQAIVIGAGPAGLAVAGCLAQAGLRATVLESGDSPGTSWRGHYRRLQLHTVKELSALPGLPFPDSAPRYVPRQQVVEYLEAYARHFQLRPRFGQQVNAVQRDNDSAWCVRTAQGEEHRAAHVVVATGANRDPHSAHYPGQETYRGWLLHSRDYLEPAPFAGQRVLVVGMGNTGAEIALDLAEGGAASVALSVRSAVNIVKRDVLGRPTQRTALMLSRLPPKWANALGTLLRDLTVGDLSRWGLRAPALSPLAQLREEGRTPVIDLGTVAAIRAGRIGVRPGMQAFTATGVRWADGREEDWDAVIMATGYRAGLQRLFPADRLPLDAHGLPTATSCDAPLDGLHFVGFDLRQPGGLLRTIAAQAQDVAGRIAG